MKIITMHIDLTEIERGHFSAVVNDKINGVCLNEVSEYHEPDTSGKLNEGENCHTYAEIEFASPAQIRALMSQLLWLESEMERQKNATKKDFREKCF